ncbi:uncharacterized protein LOC131153573 [Malania oleifera]|uniref:uncharacterized protein LOC131153573 n=1 Tax=Malania oleifera TaxID=397392 RepID=UPI0025AE1D05|nr:uncharacterized protein LOC131153573 [Malania oleifera]XP_057961961.1 uncharacterized protein LOC131153573 [Malania oleifera]XP_057961962.1 uncharacterized protein LOC131153573 [Malania oleifera]XP_057961963.1 uncharacterized protein LOC131153573 [Malania oleifera]XP_057961964.1 uncharacterized protein LOC131153573 [Malania oleifera]
MVDKCSYGRGYCASKMSDCKGSTSTIPDVRALHKELDEASCPICMDYPHNAVLLLCSSHDKGCRSYICDTSYRHSNCLDRFRKLRVDNGKSPSGLGSSSPRNPDTFSDGQFPNNIPTFEPHLDSSVATELAEARGIQGGNDHSEGGDLVGTSHSESFREMNILEESSSGNLRSLGPKPNLKCPLCRGSVQGWKIVKEARQYLDLKHRSCSQESCSFFGNYRELRRHARRVHPTIRPANIDPSRERAWQHLEHQREYGDIVSAIRSAMPGAVVVGDYAIDNGDAFSGNSESNEFEESSDSWWTTYFLFQMISSSNSRRHISQPRGLSRVWPRNRRSSGSFSSRRNHWGENHLVGGDEEGWHLSHGDMDEDASPRPRRRRRFARSRRNED